MSYQAECERGIIEFYRRVTTDIGAVRSAYVDAAHICNAFAKDLIEQNRNGKRKPSRVILEFAQMIEKLGNEIFAMRDKIIIAYLGATGALLAFGFEKLDVSSNQHFLLYLLMLTLFLSLGALSMVATHQDQVSAYYQYFCTELRSSLSESEQRVVMLYLSKAAQEHTKHILAMLFTASDNVRPTDFGYLSKRALLFPAVNRQGIIALCLRFRHNSYCLAGMILYALPYNCNEPTVRSSSLNGSLFQDQRIRLLWPTTPRPDRYYRLRSSGAYQEISRE
jgi:hypothetical protein